MPGPGGGGHGGGGGRGGGFGGGGGGFHGGGGRGPGFGGGYHGGPPHRPPHHHPPYGGWHRPPFWGGWYPRRRYYGGGGCFGGLVGAMIAPVLVVLFLIVFGLSMCQNGLDVNINGSYNEETFQDYADDQYAKYFSNGSAYEDNLLIVVLTTENNSDFYYMAWVGDHIATPINHLMGNNATALGNAMNACINESNYKYSLDSNLAEVIDTMTDAVTDLGLEKPFTCKESQSLQATFANDSQLPMTDSTVQASLDRFVENTGIPVVLVVEDAEDIFTSQESSMDGKYFSTTGIVLVAVVVIVVIIISKKQKPKTDD